MITKKELIIVATHKDYDFPKDQGYLPLHVGKEGSSVKFNLQGDNTGDNISSLNKYFCETTGLYWSWKNTSAEIYGLSHYRRYFKPINDKVSVANNEVASAKDLSLILNNYDVILSKPRNYWIETIKQHYSNAHHESDLFVLRDIISILHPDYLHSFDKVMNGRKLSLYNMFVMRSDLFHNYCEWLFSVLFEIEKRIPYKEYGPYQGRVFGFMAERLLNVWVTKNITPNKIYFQPVINIEGENILLKGIGLLERKFRGTKRK